MVLKYKKVRPGAALPGRATPGSAAADLRAVCGDEGVTLRPMGRAAVSYTHLTLPTIRLV